MTNAHEHPTMAIVGATGLVGRELLACLSRSPLGLGPVRLFASARSAGTTLPWRGATIPQEDPDSPAPEPGSTPEESA